MKPKKVAIVAEWLTSRGGAERVVKTLLEIFPKADLYTTVFNQNVFPELKNRHPKTSFLQKIPFCRKRHQSLPPLLLSAIKSLDLKNHDLIITSSSSIGKGIKKPKGAIHICYCHTPMRYVWQPEIDNRLIKFPFGKYFINYLKKWDLNTNSSVDFFLCNSKYTQERIKKFYQRDAEVIYPPVEIKKNPQRQIKKDYYLCISRLVPYKRIDLAIRAANRLKKKLIICGNGPERKKLQSIAGKTIKFAGEVSESQKNKYLSEARALIFPTEEDFGIVPIEAMSFGTPVIAYNKGGAQESVINYKTGILFKKQSVSALTEAIKEFEKLTFDPKAIRRHSLKFSKDIFIKKIKKFIEKI